MMRFEDLAAGCDIPELVKTPTTRQLVMYAGASGDYVPIHYDKDVAQAAGHKGVIVHGALKNAFLAQMLTDWIGHGERLEALSVSYRGIDYPGDTLTCRGIVTETRQEEGRGIVDCDIWIENGAGEKTTLGRATVVLPLGR